MWVVWLFWACRDRRRSPGRPVTPTPTWRTHSSSSVSQTASSSRTHRAQTDRVTIMSHSRDTGSRGHASFNWKYWVKSHNRQTEERDQHRQLTWLHNGRSKDTVEGVWPVFLVHLLVLVAKHHPGDADSDAEGRQQQHADLWPLVQVREVVLWDPGITTQIKTWNKTVKHKRKLPIVWVFSPALAERKPPDKRPHAAVEADWGGHTEDADNPDGCSEETVEEV